MVTALLRARASRLVVVSSLVLGAGCEEGEQLDVFEGTDAGDPVIGDGRDGMDEPSDRDPGDAGDLPGKLDAGHTDSGQPPLPDAGAQPDIVLGSDCVEEFVWDPAGRTDVFSVVVASGELSGWVPEGSPGMRLESDGKYHLTVGMYMSAMSYKFVVNGSEWLPDPDSCHDEPDGNGGRNSIRYACQVPPECPVIGECPVPPATDLGDGCQTTFTFDPQGRADVERVVLVGGAPLTWDFASCDAIPLVAGEDGLFRVTVDLPLLTAPLPYKFVINDNRDGSGWTADPGNCHELDTNSLLYCENEPACPGSGGDGGVSDAGLDGGVDAAVDDGGADAAVDDGGADAGAEDASVHDAGASSDAAAPDAAPGDAGASEPDCSCFRTVWVDLEDDARVVQGDLEGVYLFGGHPDFGDWATAGGHGELSAVRLQSAGSGVWFARVAPPADGVEYKLFVRHRDGASHPPVYLNDRGNCFARSGGNDVMHTCGAEPVACTADLPPVALPGSDVDLCTRCDVTVSIPETASAAIAGASKVALRGERAPLSWSNDLELVKSGAVYSATLSLPRGRWEYLLRLDDSDALWMRDPSNGCRAADNSVLYACSPQPSCP